MRFPRRQVVLRAVVVGLVTMHAAIHGLGVASGGPWGLPADYRRRLDRWRGAPGSGPVRAADAGDQGVVTEADLAGLPAPVALYVRRCGVVGQARVTGFHARISGRIRSGPDQPWMPFTGEQANTYGRPARRLFLIRARMRGLPVDVLHVFDDAGATMRARLCGLVPILDAAGPEMDQGETVTLLNDLCLLAPGALVWAGITWQEVDDRHVRARWTRDPHTVSAELVFDDDGDLVDFVSDDRLRAARDGRSFTPLRWSTPVQQYRTVGGRRLATRGLARWHAPAPEGTFTYLELQVDDVSYVDDVARRVPLLPCPRGATPGWARTDGYPRPRGGAWSVQADPWDDVARSRAAGR